MRAEHTDQAYLPRLPVTEDVYAGCQQYPDLLPSLHGYYARSARQHLRVSYFSSSSRPSFFFFNAPQRRQLRKRAQRVSPPRLATHVCCAPRPRIWTPATSTSAPAMTR